MLSGVSETAAHKSRKYHYLTVPDRRHRVAPLALDRLEDQGGDLGRAGLARHQAVQPVQRRFLRDPGVLVGEGRDDGAGGERAGVLASVGGAGGREREGLGGAAVVAAQHRDHAVALRRLPRHPHGVLHRLRPRAGEERVIHPRGDARQPLGQLQRDVRVEAAHLRVRQLGRLLLHRRHHLGVAVPRRRDPDARGHVEVHRPVGRRDRGALAALDDEVAEALDAGEEPRRPGVP